MHKNRKQEEHGRVLKVGKGRGAPQAGWVCGSRRRAPCRPPMCHY